MVMKSGKHTYLYYDEHLQLREVKSFRMKIAGAVIALVIVSLSAIFLFNVLVKDVFGLGGGRLATVTKDNQILQEQLATLTNHVKMLESSLDTINDQGNFLRLMVDLPSVDKESRSGGTGGSVDEPLTPTMNSATSDELLRSVSSSIRRLQSEVGVQRQSYRQIVKKADYNKGFFAALPALKPMEGYYSAGEFGLRMHPVLGIFKTHEGLDIVNDIGTPIVAAADGVIAVAGQSGGGYGTVVVINHGYGYQTLYAHLSKVLVRAGQHVKRGEFVAKSGRTGLVSGPHLHYEVRYNGVCQNPVNYFFDDVNPLHYQIQIAAH